MSIAHIEWKKELAIHFSDPASVASRTCDWRQANRCSSTGERSTTGTPRLSRLKSSSPAVDRQRSGSGAANPSSGRVGNSPPSQRCGMRLNVREGQNGLSVQLEEVPSSSGDHAAKHLAPVPVCSPVVTASMGFSNSGKQRTPLT